MKPDFIYYNEGSPLAYFMNHDYNSHGNLTQIYTYGASIGASQVNFTYEPNGIRVLTATDVLGHVTTNTYDTYGRLYTETDYLSNVVTYLYDGLGRRSSVSSTLGPQVNTAYIWTGTNKPSLAIYGISQTHNTGMVEIAWYDKLQRVVRTEKKGFNGQMILTDTEYNALGETYRVSDPYFAGGSATWAETYTYNQWLLTDIARNSGRNTHFDYSAIRVTETTGGKVTWKETNSRGLLTRAHDGGGDIIYSYYPDGKLKNIENPGSVLTTMQYADAARNQTQLVDPSAGIVNYTYNSLGQIKTTTNARSQLTTYNYHSDGRISTIVRPEGTTSYTYNTSKQLTGISSPNSVSRTYGYDTKGRVSSVGENIAGSNFSTSFTFDSYGRLGTLTHPSGIVETLGYNSYGYCSTVSAGGATRFTGTNMNARQQLTSATYGSGTTLNATYGFDAYGYPNSTAAGSVQDYRYVFDPVKGNLSSRQNYLRNKSESFNYSSVDYSLTRVLGPQNLLMTYNVNGNISTKSDVGTATFGYGTNAGPYALSSVTSTGLIPTTDQSVTYTSFEKASLITESVYSASFIYNADNQRAKMTVVQNGSTLLTRWYSGSRYMKETAGGVTKEYTYLGGDAYTAPVAAVTQSGTTNYFYLLRDYLGNITHQVNTSNVVVAEYNFDACSVKLGFCERSETKTVVELIPMSEAGREGRRRSADDWSYTLDANDLALFADRGFTGHKYLKYFNLYNMNGRLYDPLVSRFLSPDPYIQDHTSTLDYNRYAYCLNNPLKYTDPSGNKYFQFVDPEFGPEGQLRWHAPNLDAIFRNARKSGGSMYNGGSYGALGQGVNGRGLNGVYYDWYNDSYRSTNMGNSELDWGHAYNNSILPSGTVYRYGPIGGWSNEAKDGYYINIKPIYGWYDASGWNNTVPSGQGGGGNGYSEALYLANTINSLYDETATRNLRALEREAAGWMKVTRRVPGSINKAMDANKFTKVITKSVGKKLYGVGLVFSAVDMYQDPSARNVAWNVADNLVGFAAFVPGLQIPALIYFTGRISYDIYDAYNEP